MLFSESPPLYLAEQVAELDRLVIEHGGIPAHRLMKRAGRKAFEQLLNQWPETQALHIFCGAGNNAGDGYVVAALAKQRNLHVQVWYLREPTQLRGAALQAYQYALQEGVSCKVFDASTFIDQQLMQSPNTVLLDALLGTGVTGELQVPFAQAVGIINSAKEHYHWPVLALDIPTGVDPDTGAIASVAINADATISFIGQKQGLFTGAGMA